MAKPKKFDSNWKAAICYNARSVATLIRESLEELDFKFTRSKSSKHFSSLKIIVPWPENAYVFQFKVIEPSEFIINTYDIQPTHTSEVHYVELQKLKPENINDARRVLKQMVSKLDRKPWKIFWAERLRYAILAPEYLEAKSAWYSMGIS